MHVEPRNHGQHKDIMWSDFHFSQKLLIRCFVKSTIESVQYMFVCLFTDHVYLYPVEGRLPPSPPVSRTRCVKNIYSLLLNDYMAAVCDMIKIWLHVVNIDF